MAQSVRIAVEGCCHGELDKIYAEIMSKPQDEWPELLVICGDFQSVRDAQDLDSLAVPTRFRKMGDFSKYYSGQKMAPVRTLFIGGNHEASNYLSELKNGGWVAPNIYFLGYANTIWFKNLRICGISGIYKKFDFYRERRETLPLNDQTKRSIYHTRFRDVLKILLIKHRNVDLVLSHDWPEGIYNYGDRHLLLKKKPFFKTDVEIGDLGSKPNMVLLKHVQPRYWFSAHLHVYFEADVKHDDNTYKNDDEIDLDLDEPEEETEPKQTKFIALDKCLPKRKFLKLIDIPVSNDNSCDNDDFYYDYESLKIEKWLQENWELVKDLKISDLLAHNSQKLIEIVSQIEIQSDSDPQINLKVPYNFEPTPSNPKDQMQAYQELTEKL